MRLLDVCCGAGGAAVGYHRAGFEVVGVDLEPQPDFPFEFHQADGIEFVKEYGHEFDVIHASWPCQAYTSLIMGNQAATAGNHVKLIEPGREAMLATGVPLVLENVITAGLRRDVVLCGEMFGLGVIRHRVFELHGWSTTQPRHVKHRGRVQGWRHGVYSEGPYFQVHGEGGGKGSVPEWQKAMGIDWTDNRRSIAEAIPPAYTQWMGEELLTVFGQPLWASGS